MNIFNELARLFGRRPSGETAKARLQFVLLHDRSGLEGGRLELLRRDLVEVLSKYVEIDCDALEIEVHRESGLSALVVSSPLRAH
jgi:cell division topological specificity factor